MVFVVTLYFPAYINNDHFPPQDGIRNLIKTASAGRPSQQQASTRYSFYPPPILWHISLSPPWLISNKDSPLEDWSVPRCQSWRRRRGIVWIQVWFKNALKAAGKLRVVWVVYIWLFEARAYYTLLNFFCEKARGKSCIATEIVTSVFIHSDHAGCWASSMLATTALA